MAISKKYSRRIVVDGEAYRWRVRAEVFYQTGYDGLLVATVWSEPGPGQVLTVVGDRHPNCRYLDGYAAATDTFTPKRIADAIREALRSGWKPACRGQAVMIRSHSDI
ncbi:hypothetical protein [Gemmata sp.]|uniref:hypothetical protein n=1 Tax=Gemmata sp. TaxID=1914242 RepID=UPI003F6EDCDA